MAQAMLRYRCRGLELPPLGKTTRLPIRTLFIRTLWRHTMTIKESANLLFEITHPEQAFSFAALKEYLENMYFG